MQLTTETFGQVLVVHTPDELNCDTASDFLAAVLQCADEGQVNMILEMDRTETYDSEGLTMLLDLQDRLLSEGGNAKICGLGDPGRKIFEVTRMQKRFDIFESVIDAVSSFR